MDESPPPRMDSPPPDADNSGQSETDSSLVGLSPELPTSPHGRESSQSCDVSTDKSDVFPESSETKSGVETHDSAAEGTTKILPAGDGAHKDVTAGATSKDSSTVEEEQPSRCKDELKPEKRGDSAEQASRTSPQSGIKAVMRAKMSTRTDISGRLARGETIAVESASARKDDPEPAEQKTSKTEPSSTVCREETKVKSGKTMTNVEALDAASSRAGQPENEPAATAESEDSEKQSGERSRWSIWSKCISHELSMPMRRRAPPEDVGPPVSHTAVGQRLLQIFRERQETAQNIARETSGETHAVMQEMLPELRVPGNRTIRECEQELEQSAATASQGGEEREANKTDAPVPQDNQNETSRSETEAIADGAGKPLERLINLPEESKHTTSDSASRRAQESKQKLSSPAAERSPDLEPESPISETVSQDRRNEPPQQSTTVPAHSADVPSQITAELPDYRQGQSSRSYIDQPPRVFQRQSISPLNLWPRKPTLMQSRTSAFTLVRKVLFEEPPPHLEEQATSSTKLPDDSAEPAMKAGPSVPRKISPLAASPEQKKTPVSLQRLGKRNVSSGSESTDEESSVGPTASKRRAEDTRSAAESQDATDESIPSPPDESTSSPPDESTSSPPDESTSSPPDESMPSPPDEGTPSPPDEGTPSPPGEGTPSPPDESTSSPPDESTSSPPDESMPSPPAPAEHYFRAIELAPASAASGEEVSRPVALRAPITAQASSTYISGATDVSGLREPSVGKLGDCTSDKGTVPSGDDCGSDVDMASPSSTPRSSKHQLEREHTSPARESESTKIADDNSGGAKEPSGPESDITVVQFKGVAKGLSYSEARSDSSEISASGGAGAVARSGHGSSAVASNSPNTADKDRDTRAESDTARSGAGRTSQDTCSEYEGLTETGSEQPTQGSGDSKASTPPSAEGAEGHEVSEDVQAPHSDSEVEAGDATADSRAKEA